MDKVTIYTDGSSGQGVSAGGWAALFIYGDDLRLEMCGHESVTTSVKMELTAAMFALSQLKRPCKVELISDSELLIKGMNEYRFIWQANRWRSANGYVKNKTLWQKIINFASIHHIKWTWVRGHDGNHWNEYCDKLAKRAKKEKLNLTNYL